MIISEKPEEYDGSLRILKWEPSEDGQKVEPRSVRTENEGLIQVYLDQRVRELRRLRRALVSGRISPVAFFMEYQSMTAKELASRTRIPVRRIRKHMTMAGFGTCTVDELRRYARVFDVAVADFFQLLYLPERLEVHASTHQQRTVQERRMSPATPVTSAVVVRRRQARRPPRSPPGRARSAALRAA